MLTRFMGPLISQFCQQREQMVCLNCLEILRFELSYSHFRLTALPVPTIEYPARLTSFLTQKPSDCGWQKADSHLVILALSGPRFASFVRSVSAGYGYPDLFLIAQPPMSNGGKHLHQTQWGSIEITTIFGIFIRRKSREAS